MTEAFPARSTYRAPFTIRDRDGTMLDMTAATVTYHLSTDEGDAGEVVVAKNDGDPGVDMAEAGAGVVTVELTPTETDRVGTFYEEVRVTFPDERSAVTVQRAVQFESVSTAP